MSAANRPLGSRLGEAPQALPAAGSGSPLIAALGAPLDVNADVNAGVGAVARPALAAGVAPSTQSSKPATLFGLLDPQGSTVMERVLNLAPVRFRGKKGEEAHLFAPFERRIGNAALAREHIAALGLNPEEEKLLRSLFSKWSLEPGICLMDLWGLDLYKSFDSLGLSEVERSVLQGKFSGAFIHIYLSLFAKKCKKTFAEALKGRDFASNFFWPAKKLEGHFQLILKMLQGLRQAKLSRTTNPEHRRIWQEAYDNVIAKLELGRKLVNHPQDPQLLLVDLTLEQCFSGSRALNGPEPLKTLDHLIANLEFQLACLNNATHLITLVDFPKALKELRDLLVQFRKGRTVENLKLIRQALNRHFFALSSSFSMMERDANEAIKGRRTYQNCYGSRKMPGGHVITQQAFYSREVWSFAQIFVLQGLLQDVLRIVDLRIVPLLMPRVAAGYASFARLIYNTSRYVAISRLENLRNEHSSKVLTLVADFENTHFQQPAVARLYERLGDFLDLAKKTSFHYSQSMSFLFEWIETINHLNKTWPELDTLRQQALSQMKKEFGAQYSLADLQTHRQKLVQTVKENFLHWCLPLCMRVLILKDIETIVLGEVVEMNDDNDHLIPPELANLAAMEGIEETMTDLIKEKEAEQILRRPPAPSAPQGPPAVAAPQIVPVAAPPGELSRAEAWILELLARTRAQESDPLWVITSSEPAVAVPARRNSAEVRQFKLRSGMNIRQVLEKIEEAGFQCLSQKGSHMKFKNEEGKVVIVPNNDAMPTGTLKSIERQVEDAKTSKQG